MTHLIKPLLICLGLPLAILSTGSLLDRAVENSQERIVEPQLDNLQAVIRLRAKGKWSDAQIRALAQHIVKLSRRYNFSPAFILSVIDVESRFNQDAVSEKGALGLMQIMPATAHYLAERMAIGKSGELAARDPKMNVEMALHYLQELRNRYKDPQQYLAAYNQGPARVDELLRSGQAVPNIYYNKVVKAYRSYYRRAY